MKRINIDGYIIDEQDRWVYDLFEVPYVTLGKLRAFLFDAKDSDIELVINCFGGDVWTAATAYDELRNYKGNSTARVAGVSASASSFLMLGCNKVVASPMASIMIHNSQTHAEGDYRAMEHAAEVLRSINNTIINAYEIKTGKSRDELQKYMDDETWLTAQDALELGIIDEILLKDGEKLSEIKASAVVSSRIAACFNPLKMHAIAAQLHPPDDSGDVSRPVSDSQKDQFRSIRNKILSAYEEGKTR